MAPPVPGGELLEEYSGCLSNASSSSCLLQGPLDQLKDRAGVISLHCLLVGLSYVLPKFML